MNSPGKVIFIRHAEKPDAATGGVLIDGSEDDESLTATGWQRAGSLAVLFGFGQAPINLNLSRPTAIYAANATGASKSQRPIETVTPLSAKLGVPLIVNFDATSFVDMVGQALTQGQSTVLICWEHKTMAAGLNATSNPLRILTANAANIPSEWPSDRFDVLWVFTLQSDGTYVFSQVPQLLLHGDVEATI